MRAIVIKENTSQIPCPSETNDPQPTNAQVVVDVHSTALNFFDILQAQGKYQYQPPHPFVLGSEFAGRIASDSPIPKGCPFRPGDRVFGASQGAFAEKVAANWKQLLPIPSNLSYDEAAGLFVTWPTSYEALVGRAELKSGEWVLVTAAAGGVGIAAVQIAKALGAKVIAAASTSKLDICKSYGGADYAVDYTKQGWQEEVLKITGRHGVDVVYDPVGLIKDCLKCIAWKGRALVVGFAAGTIEKIPMNLVLLKNISLVGVFWGATTTKEPERVVGVWKALLQLLESGNVKPVVYPRVYSFENLPQGLEALGKRETWGKVVVSIMPKTKL